MQIPRSIRLARLSALIVLFILSSVSVGYVAVRVVGDRNLPADTVDQATARASTHTSAATAAPAHVSSPFMAYGASGATARIADDGDADDYLVASTALTGSSTDSSFQFVESGGGNRDFTGSSTTKTSRHSGTGSGGFAASIGGGIGAAGGVSGTSQRKNNALSIKTAATTRTTTHTSTSPSKSSNHSGGGSSSGTSGGGTAVSGTSAGVAAGGVAADASAGPGVALTTTGAGATGGVVALGVTGGVTGKVGATGSSPAPTPEPISLLLIGSGLCGAFGARRVFS